MSNNIKYRYTGFFIPIIDGQICLAQRGTEPFKGYFGAIGGKAEYNFSQDKSTSPKIFDRPHLITQMGGHVRVSISDRIADYQQRERPSQSAIREFLEEIFSEKKFPEDFSEDDIKDTYNLGTIEDVFLQNPNEIWVNEFIMGKINRVDFSPNTREVMSFKPLEKLTSGQIFPLTKMALHNLKWMITEWHVSDESPLKKYDMDKLVEQIPQFKIPYYRRTSMLGLNNYFLKNNMFPQNSIDSGLTLNS